MAYLIIFLLLLILSYRYDYCRISRGENFWFYAVLVIFILLAGLRYRVGGDTINYIGYYESTPPITQLKSSDFIDSRFAPGYILISSIGKLFSRDFTIIQILHSAFVNIIFFRFIRLNCKNIFFALLLFFCFQYALLLFEQIRESFAVAIFILAWPTFRDGKWWLWYLASVCAFLFHVSAVMMFFLPLFTLPGIRKLFVFGTRTWIVCILILVVGIAINVSLFKYIQLLALTESIAERAQTYSKDELSGSLFNFGGLISIFFRNIFYPLLAMYFLQQNKKMAEGSYNLSFKKQEFMALMSVYVSIFTIAVAIASRYNNYFFIFAIAMISDWIFGNIRVLGKTLRLQYLYWLMLFIPMFGFQFYSVYLGNVTANGTIKTYSMYYPYYSILNEQIDRKREDGVRYLRHH